jgi:hypothetical protein
MHIFLQTTLIPTTLWGTQFPLVPFAYVTNQSYQIVANTNGTIVNVSITEQSYRLDAGQYLEITVDDSAMLTSNFPIQLVQLGQVQLNIVFKSFAIVVAACRF